MGIKCPAAAGRAATCPYRERRLERLLDLQAAGARATAGNGCIRRICDITKTTFVSSFQNDVLERRFFPFERDEVSVVVVDHVEKPQPSIRKKAPGLNLGSSCRSCQLVCLSLRVG